MDPIEKGKRTEERGFRALDVLKQKHPHFILKMRRASPAVDGRGIDAIVVIKLPKGTTKPDMSVPLEFKSSWLGVTKWKVVHRDLYDAGVLIFYIPQSEYKVQRLIYRALHRVQLNSRDGTLYHSLFQRLFSGGSRNLWRNIALIKKSRAKEKKSPSR
ncbi:hypothetical protein A2765_04000 [Candidatus Kaiserbacteria bacterium RIFCSPHIGHO2_01_FULL_56_24]|uniref:Uncharacterized protein n=1 Tax=Candidatus Kaiserbacteria bacterium RIFCSPHIGHO2_01_FULL_56_24 TaxID=1798487 RepID=A0A1F6DE57_9BACT|nr:MAG: hypothetical protein A2765_04000 [Candidatus Kaiserbacteria bacterium RIFCSPHIGHO2_01_FULL_56_24]